MLYIKVAIIIATYKNKPHKTNQDSGGFPFFFIAYQPERVMDPEEELLNFLSKDELEIQVAEKIQSFHGFLTREVALRLLAKEKGLLKTEEKTYKLIEIPKGEKRISFTARVKKVWPIAQYSSGKRSRVVEVEDETAGKPLILWNDDIELTKTLRAKDEISVKGAYEKNSELHLGYSGTLDIISKAPFSDLAELKDNDRVHLRGFVGSIEGYDSFVHGNTMKKGFSFMISDGKNERRCVIFEKLARADHIQAGDEIIIEGALVKNSNVEMDEHSRILTRRRQDMLLGELTKLETKNSELVVEVGGKSAALDRENALRFLKAEASEDIALSTVVELKKRSLLNSKIAVRVENKEGRILIR